jgi:HD-GYP domain-containing protein (c-di-GMP phosphodiesterase class II)
VLHHHERFDGHGYPHGLRGTQVPRSARIVSVADAYDAKTTDRPYRQALSPNTAFERLRSGSGSQWEGLYVEALIAAVGSRTLRALLPE